MKCNQNDDFTNAVMRINPEFGDLVSAGESVGDTTKETTKEIAGKLPKKTKTTKETVEKLPKKPKTTKETGTKLPKKKKNTTKENNADFSEIEEQIITLLKADSHITASRIAEALGGITADGVRYHLRMLKKKGVIGREGATKGGNWVIL